MALLDALLLDPYPFEIWIAKRTDGVGGSGTLNDPYDGSTAAKFDALMNTISAMSADKVGVVHLGPGAFLTNGFNSRLNTGWQVKAGTRIVGSGVDSTTLQLTGATESTTATHYFAVAHAITDGTSLRDLFEISD